MTLPDWLLQLSVLLAIAVVLGLLARRVGLPHTVGWRRKCPPEALHLQRRYASAIGSLASASALHELVEAGLACDGGKRLPPYGFVEHR